METSGEGDTPGAGSTSAQVVPDGGPSLSLTDPGLWLGLGLGLLLLPLFFLARRRRKKRREAQRGYT